MTMIDAHVCKQGLVCRVRTGPRTAPVMTLFASYIPGKVNLCDIYALGVPLTTFDLLIANHINIADL